MSIMLSIDKNNTKTSNKLEINYFDTLEDIVEQTCTYNYSPFIFKDGLRKGENFMGATLLIIDVDDGFSIDEAKEKLAGYKSIIVTTKSHQLGEKNGKPIKKCDRYRIFIQLQEEIYDKEVYKKVISKLIEDFNGDRACKDIARFYYHNPKQLVYKIDGDEFYDISKYVVEDEASSSTIIDKQTSEKIVLGSGTLVVNDKEKSFSIGEWATLMPDKGKEMVHCPLSPEKHKNNDAQPSCQMTRNKGFLNFKCFACGSSGYYNSSSSETKAEKGKSKIPVFDKNSCIADIKIGLKDVSSIIDEYIKFLPSADELSNDYDILGNIFSNGIFEIKTFEQTLHIGYEGKWYKIGNREKEALSLVKPIIEKTFGYKIRVASSLIKEIHTELLVEYKKLDSYLLDESIYINLENLVIAISKSGEIIENDLSLDYGFRWQLPFSYDKDAKCPLFEQFLQTSIGAEDTIKVLQEYMGYIFLSHKTFNLEKALWLLGSGANGKSVLTATLRYVYGEENVSYLDLPELENEEKRTMLNGKILNISQDATNNMNESSYKTMVSGEKIIARELYKGSFILNSVPKIIIATNEMPKIRNGLDAFIRRTIIIPFDNVVPEAQRDIHLHAKLKEEIAGIFNFALEGLKRLIQQGHFTKSLQIENALKNFRGESDILDDFFTANPITIASKEDGRYIHQTELLKKLSQWCKENGIRNSYSSPRRLANDIANRYSYSVYKNNSIYGIRGYWNKNVEMIVSNVPSEKSDYAL